MAIPPVPRVVAVIDSDPDGTELLKTILEMHGMVVATGNLTEFRVGKANFLEFLQRVAPDVIVYDVGLPYEANYQFLEHARENPAFPRCGIVITTTNARSVERLLGVRALEILGKPYDLEVLVEAVRRAQPQAEMSFGGILSGTEPGDDERQMDERRSGNDRRTHARRNKSLH